MWSRTDRRSCRQRSGRSVHQRDARGNISVSMTLTGLPAAKQREGHSALFAVKAEPEPGRS